VSHIISHRVNTVEQLKKLDPAWGAEIDLRGDPASPGKIYIAHDPWTTGEDFETWLAIYKQTQKGTLILNTKEDGLETRIIELLGKAGVKNFFFLDTALPTLVKWTQQNKKTFFAIRFSTFEPTEFVEKFKGTAEWLWVDGFQGIYPPKEQLRKLTTHFKLCLVSPELQGLKTEIYPRTAETDNLFTAVCTKIPAYWTSGT
jgi:hypothetical protein